MIIWNDLSRSEISESLGNFSSSLEVNHMQVGELIWGVGGRKVREGTISSPRF